MQTNKKTLCFYDFEATSVARNCDPVSVGLVAVTRQAYIKSATNLSVLESKTGEASVMIGNEYKVIDFDNINTIDGKEYPEYVHIIDDNDEFTSLYGPDDCDGPIYYKEEVKTFYAEFDDFNPDKADQWVKDKIIEQLPLKFSSQVYQNIDNNFKGFGNTRTIKGYLKEWLSQFNKVEFWADFDIIDKPLLVDLIADWDTQVINCKIPPQYSVLNNSKLLTAGEYSKAVNVGLPKHLDNVAYYEFYDLHTLFKNRGIDPDINREEYIYENTSEILLPNEIIIKRKKHYALWDAYVNWQCYDKLNS